MNKIWIVARHEYLFHLRRRGFLISTFLMPIILMILFVIVILLLFKLSSIASIGYIDHARLFHQVSPDLTYTYAGDKVRMIRYATLDEAQTALRDQTVEAVFEVPSDYVAQGKVTAYALEGLPSFASTAFDSFLQATIIQRLEVEPSPRVLEPITELYSNVLDTSPDQARQSFVATVLPMMFGVILLGSTFAGGSYLMLALLEEKEQRIMEILASSVSTYQLMIGKVLGLGALALTQLLIWTGGGLVLLIIAATKLGFIGAAGVPVSIIVLMIMLFFPAYFLIAATLSAIGAAVQSPQQGQQLTGVVTLLSTLPLWFLTILRNQPNGIVAAVLTIIPYTAPITLMQRAVATAVPLWQHVVVIVWLWVAAGLMMLLAGKIVRLGLLRYNAAVRVREIWQALRKR